MKLYCEKCRQQTPHAHTKNWRLCEYCGYSTQLTTPQPPQPAQPHCSCDSCNPTRPSESPTPDRIVAHNPDVESQHETS